MTLHAATVETPVGSLFVAVDERGALTRCETLRDRSRAEIESHLKESLVWNARACSRVTAELDAYFRGALTHFTIETAPGGTVFQRRVWSELERIPFGTTISYLELARRVGNPKAVRAVGGANGANPIAIIVPCHRVVGSDGSLTGYGGGLAMKQALLALEGVRPHRLFA